MHWKDDTEAEVPILWPPDAKNWIIGKKSWCWERLRAGEEGVTENEIAGYNHWLNGHKSEQTPGDSEGQGSLAYCSSWSCKESHTT